MKCKICSGKIELFASDTILNKFVINYFRCSLCGFIQTEEPYWLAESYSKPITSTDVGLVSRNLFLASVTAKLINLLRIKNGSFLDYGGGYGLFTRIMRDYGFDFRWYDKHCQNIFAHGFEAEDHSKYDLVTAYEVIEHLSSPLEDLQAMREKAPIILLTTELLPPGPPKPQDWWYYGLNHGQHVSFFTRKSLRIAAERLGLKVVSWGSVHLFSSLAFPKLALGLACVHPFDCLSGSLFKKKSLLKSDQQFLLQKHEDTVANNLLQGEKNAI